MTNKGTKFLEKQLKDTEQQLKEKSREMNNQSIKMLEMNERGLKMEEDLLSLCNCTLLRGFWRLRLLRIDLKKRTAKAKKS